MTFKPTLAVAADFKKLQFPVFASPKLDGIRCSVVDGRAVSRTLKAIPNKHIYSALSHEVFNGLDGELVVGSPTSKSCYTDSVSGVMAHDTTPDFTYYLFDLHTQPGAFQARLEALRDWHDGVFSAFPFFKVLEQVVIQDFAGLLAYEESCIAEGYEGVILRGPSAPYKHGRSTVNEGYLLKVKRFEDSDAVIVGFEEEMFNGNEAETNELGRTKRSTANAGLSGKGSLGAFLVRDYHTGVEFAVGTGLTAEQRASAWRNRDRLVGSMIKYKFFPVGVKDKPRHPVFLGMRDRIDL